VSHQPAPDANANDVNANDVVAFGVEVLAVVLLAVWGASLGATTVARVVGGIGVPAVAVVLWGCFAAPRAVVRVPALAVATKVLVLGGAALASFAVLPMAWAVVVTVVIVVNTLLTWVGPYSRHVRSRPPEVS
jgi:hypothetical protein